MRRVILSLALLAALGAAAGGTARAEEALVTFKVLSPETALELARATLKACRDEGYQTAVAVVDRFGVLQVLLRDRFAGPLTPEGARRKAVTAVSTRTNTLEMAEMVKAGTLPSGIQEMPGALVTGGGVMVQAAGSLVGGVGVAGAPGGALDEACARTGIEAIEDKIAF
jgi:uncharacterized protein GlcG (DUF336 family)